MSPEPSNSTRTRHSGISRIPSDFPYPLCSTSNCQNRDISIIRNSSNAKTLFHPLCPFFVSQQGTTTLVTTWPVSWALHELCGGHDMTRVMTTRPQVTTWGMSWALHGLSSDYIIYVIGTTWVMSWTPQKVVSWQNEICCHLKDRLYTTWVVSWDDMSWVVTTWPLWWALHDLCSHHMTSVVATTQPMSCPQKRYKHLYDLETSLTSTTLGKT